MSNADAIRSHVNERHVQPARAAGQTEVRVRLGTIRTEMGLTNPLQSVRSALATQIFEKTAGVELVEPIPPQAGADYHCLFRIRAATTE